MLHKQPVTKQMVSGPYALITVLALILLLGACAGASAPESAPSTAPNVEAPAPAAAAAADGAQPDQPAPAAVSDPIPVDQLQIDLTPIAQVQDPLFVTHAGDGSGRIFIVEKAGTIRILQDRLVA